MHMKHIFIVYIIILHYRVNKHNLSLRQLVKISSYLRGKTVLKDSGNKTQEEIRYRENGDLYSIINSLFVEDTKCPNVELYFSYLWSNILATKSKSNSYV